MKRTICNFASSLNSSRSSLASVVAHEQQQYTKNFMSYSTATGTSGLTNILTKKHVGKYPQEYLESFEVYNKLNAKFRVAVVNTCNMNCFFCHNEGMENPRSLGDKTPIKKQGKEPFPVKELVRMMNDFCDLGGTQLNITGGEPLVRKDIVEVLNSIDKQNTRVVLNSNILLAERLLREPKVPQVDAIYASLHTTRESDFKKYLGINAGAEQVMKNMVLLKEHGYRVQINYSLGDYNKDEFENVLKFALPNKIDLKVISLIRSNLDKSQYCNPDEEKSWTNPKWLEDLMERNGVQVCGTREGFGGRVKIYKTNESSDHRVEIKNIGRGRLMTDYCNGCRFADKCGEGIYAVRSGVDGLWKPCVLNSDKFSTMKIEDPSDDYKMQILSVVHNMVGEWKNHQFVEGSPQ